MVTKGFHRGTMLILGLLLVMVAASNNAAQAQTQLNTVFTYQGSLSDGGNPANGAYDFQFRLYTDVAQGAQVGPILSTEDVSVTLGLFVVTLDFGAVFDGTPRYLELAVRPGNSTGEFALLSPRQALTAAPMAIFSNSANGLQNRSVSSAAPFDGQVLKWNGTQWVPSADDTLFLAGNGTSSFAARSDHDHFGQNWIGDVPYTGLWVENHSSVPGSSGVYGRSENTVGVDGNSNSGYGIQGVSQTSLGVAGFSYDPNGVGVYGRNYGNNGDADAGRFTGNVAISGNLTKGGGAFKIDHPLDPANKYLYHSFVESPDMMNIYNGNIVLGADGAAIVILPAYFEALNMEFRYQLTAIGAPGPNLYIAEEIKDNHFKIAGGTPGMKVSWQVTGIRHDPYAEAHRIPVEEDKPPQEHGKYLYPKEYGQPTTSGIDYAPQANLTSAVPAQAAQPVR